MLRRQQIVLLISLPTFLVSSSASVAKEEKRAYVCCHFKNISKKRAQSSRRYAEMYISTEQGWARVYSASDGTYLGLAPIQVKLTRSIFPREDTISLFLERKGYQSQLKLVRVPAWYSSRQRATLNQMKVFVSLVPSAAHLAGEASAPPPE